MELAQGVVKFLEIMDAPEKVFEKKKDVKRSASYEELEQLIEDTK